MLTVKIFGFSFYSIFVLYEVWASLMLTCDSTGEKEFKREIFVDLSFSSVAF